VVAGENEVGGDEQTRQHERRDDSRKTPLAESDRS
jgi:hypothetical protein